MFIESGANTLKENWKILLSKELVFPWLYMCDIKENTFGNRVS